MGGSGVSPETNTTHAHGKNNGFGAGLTHYHSRDPDRL